MQLPGRSHQLAARPAIALLLAFALAIHAVLAVPAAVDTTASDATDISPATPIKQAKLNNLEYRVVQVYPHDSGAFTQGLLYAQGKLYESTGLFGQSELREVDLTTGRVLRKQKLQAEDFGEGLALVGEQLLQLTWTSNHGFIWNRASFSLVGTMPYLFDPTAQENTRRGWGLCYNGVQLVLSNGSNKLFFLHAESFQQQKVISVFDENGAVGLLNELECIGDRIMANVWTTDRIVIINPADGRVTANLDLSQLYPLAERKTPQNLLNGIAYDAAEQRLFVTGKRWPRLYQIELPASAMLQASP